MAFDPTSPFPAAVADIGKTFNTAKGAKPTDRDSATPEGWYGEYCQWFNNVVLAITTHLFKCFPPLPTDGGGLDIDFEAFRWRDGATNYEVAAGSYTLTDDQVNYVSIEPDSSPHHQAGSYAYWPWCKVTTAAGVIVSIEDARAPDTTGMGSSVAFVDLSDTPAAYAGAAADADKVLLVNAAGDGVEFGFLTDDNVDAAAAIAWSKIDASAATLDAIGDVTAATADAQALFWDDVASEWVPALITDDNVDPAAAIAWSKIDASAATLDSIGDVTAASEDGQTLFWDAAAAGWVPADPFAMVLTDDDGAPVSDDDGDLVTT